MRRVANRHTAMIPAILALTGAALIVWVLRRAARAILRRQTRARVIRIVDGDTFTARFQGEEITVRCASFDAREKGEPGGEDATAALRAILTGAGRVDLHRPRRDQWGRVIATVTVDGRVLGARMVAASMTARYLHRRPEFARPWAGSRDKTWR